MTSTPEQAIEKIREALEAGPTPGPWNSYSLPESNTQGPSAGRLVGVPEIYRDRSSWFRPEDAAYIAACDPQNIAVLLAALQSSAPSPQEQHDPDSDPIQVLSVENVRLRHIVSDCAAALMTGAFISPKASVEFMEGLPKEISLVVSELRARTLLAGDNHE